jgi:hypothetical protein
MVIVLAARVMKNCEQTNKIAICTCAPRNLYAHILDSMPVVRAMYGTQMFWEPGNNFGPDSWKVNYCEASVDDKALSGRGCLQNIQTWSITAFVVFQFLTPASGA